MADSEYLTPGGELVAVGGELRLDASPAPDVLLTLRTPLGSCPLDPTFGDETLRLTKVTRSTRKLVELYTKRALAWIVAEGRISDLTVDCSVDGRAVRRTVSYKWRGQRYPLELPAIRIGG